VIVAKPSATQKRIVATLVQRADAIRTGLVKPQEDNMLAVTTDGRKAALDVRLVEPFAEDDKNSKVNLAVENIFRIWEQYSEQRLTQLVFCDLYP
jgi:dissimilatory sulfite reductase (desulfoviridin) alpha/beta subunit